MDLGGFDANNGGSLGSFGGVGFGGFGGPGLGSGGGLSDPGPSAMGGAGSNDPGKPPYALPKPVQPINAKPANDPKLLAQKLLARASQRGQNQLTARGINQQNTGNYWGQISSGLSSGIQGMSGLTEDNYAGKVDSLLDSLLNTATMDRRGDLQKSLDTSARSLYGDPTGNQATAQSLIDSILAPRENTARSFLENAMARGQVNPTRMTGASSVLDEQGLAARSNLDTLIQGLFDERRGTIDNSLSSARGAIADIGLTDRFSLDSLLGEARGAASNFDQNMQGKLLALVGGDPMFDPTGAIGRVNSGMMNPGTEATDLRNAIVANRSRQTNPRGLVNQGAF
jgi:hypothetical protein